MIAKAPWGVPASKLDWDLFLGSVYYIWGMIISLTHVSISVPNSEPTVQLVFNKLLN